MCAAGLADVVWRRGSIAAGCGGEGEGVGGWRAVMEFEHWGIFFEGLIIDAGSSCRHFGLIVDGNPSDRISF